jgi:hypothetical protein
MNGHVQSFHALRRIGSTSGNFLYNDAGIDPSGVISTHGLLFTHDNISSECSLAFSMLT